MNTLKKLLCMGLAATFIVSAFASCANNNDDDKPQVTQGSASKDPDEKEIEFEEADFDEAEFKFLHYGSTAIDFTDEYIWSENFTGGAIGDAVMERNQLCEDMYNVVITAEECNPMPEAIKRMQAGQCDFDVIYEWGPRSVSAALDGMLYDILEFTDIDMERSYWVPSANNSLIVGDHLFIFTNMVTMNSLSWAGLQYFNKNLMDKLNFTYPYEYVYADNWTWDVVIDMCFEAEEDVNGDGEMGIEDQFGGHSGQGIVNALCSEPAVKDNGDGTFALMGK